MLERLVGHKYFCYLDGYSGFLQIPIHPVDQDKTTFTCPYGTLPFGLCNAPGTFQGCLCLMAWNTRSLGDPKSKVWCSPAASFPSVWNQGYRTSRSSSTSEGCWWLARRNTITNVESAHNTIKLLCPNETVRLSISPACWKQRIKHMVWKNSIKLQRMKRNTLQFVVV